MKVMEYELKKMRYEDGEKNWKDFMEFFNK